MDKEQKNDIKYSYVPDDISQNKEPDYKELYFNLLSEFDKIRNHITSAMDKSAKNISKSYNASRVDDDKLNVFGEKDIK